MVDRPPFARAGVLTVAGVLGLVLLVLSGRYGPHRDELYFASAGHRLAWGYPDQPSLVALLARLSQEVAPHNLVVLRLPAPARHRRDDPAHRRHRTPARWWHAAPRS